MDTAVSIEEKVPAEFACPVCGKWGRRYKGNEFDGTGIFGVYYCNPKARRGGPGCGEIFRFIKEGACKIYSREWDKIVAGSITREGQKAYEVGNRIIENLKRFGLHYPNKRNGDHRWIKGQLLKRLVENDGTKCFCGCGETNTIEYINYKLNYEKEYFATPECKNAFGLSLWYICYPGPQLTRWYVRNFLGGKYVCQQCEQENRYMGLELDHIIEVNEGGGMCWLDNFQLLCPKCHKAKTASYAASRAKNNKAEINRNNPQISLFQ